MTLQNRNVIINIENRIVGETMKFIKNRFLFILLISIATLALLIVGALTLYKDNSLVFASDGYILETTTKTNKKYYFSASDFLLHSRKQPCM